MKVSDWTTLATYFPWPHVQEAIDGIEAVVYRHAIELAQSLHAERAKPCPGCGTEPRKLFWFSVDSPEANWKAGVGKVGFMTLCERCKLQVDFLIDDELTQMQYEQWQENRE